MVNNKKNLMIISPTVPQFDTNAGDYRVWIMTKELSRYFNIFFMPLNYKTSDLKYAGELKNKIQKIIKPVKSVSLFKKIIKNFDIQICLFEKYWSMPFDIYRFIEVSPFSVIDIHEVGFLKTAAQAQIQHITNAAIYKAKELLFYKEADLLIAISEEEKKELQKYFPDKKIFVIPTCTEVRNLKLKSFGQRKDICYFGFFKHQPNIDAVSYFTAHIFRKLQKKIPELNFNVLGNGAGLFAGLHNNIIIKEDIKDIAKELSNYKVFVCPLRYGAGLKKKVLDAMAAKTPIVSTSFGFEGIKNIQSRPLQINSGEFIEQIVKIYNDKNCWTSVSKQNFNTVKRYYSLESFAKYIKNFIKNAGI